MVYRNPPYHLRETDPVSMPPQINDSSLPLFSLAPSDLDRQTCPFTLYKAPYPLPTIPLLAQLPTLPKPKSSRQASQSQSKSQSHNHHPSPLQPPAQTQKPKKKAPPPPPACRQHYPAVPVAGQKYNPHPSPRSPTTTRWQPELRPAQEGALETVSLSQGGRSRGYRRRDKGRIWGGAAEERRCRGLRGGIALRGWRSIGTWLD